MNSTSYNHNVNASASVRLPPINGGIGETSGGAPGALADVNKPGMVSNTSNSQALIYRSVPPKPQNFTLTDMLGSGITPPTAVKSKKLGLSGNTPSEFAKRFMTRPSTQPKVIEFNVGRIKADKHRRGVNGFFPPVKLRLSAKSQPASSTEGHSMLSRTVSLETVHHADSASIAYVQLTYWSKDDTYVVHGHACERKSLDESIAGARERLLSGAQHPVGVKRNKLPDVNNGNNSHLSGINSIRKVASADQDLRSVNFAKLKQNQCNTQPNQQFTPTLPEEDFSDDNKPRTSGQVHNSDNSTSKYNDHRKPESIPNSKHSKASLVNKSNQSLTDTSGAMDSSTYGSLDKNHTNNNLGRTKSDPSIKVTDKTLSTATNHELNSVSETASDAGFPRLTWSKDQNTHNSMPVRAKSHSGATNQTFNKPEDSRRAKSGLTTVNIDFPDLDGQTKRVITREGYTVHKLRNDKFPLPTTARLQLVPTSFSEVRPRSSSRSMSRSSRQSRQSMYNRKTPESVRTAPPTDVTVVYPETFDCDDLSYLPPPKRILPKRDVPWVFRYKVKKNMNELSKIMASKPQHLIDV